MLLLLIRPAIIDVIVVGWAICGCCYCSLLMASPGEPGRERSCCCCILLLLSTVTNHCRFVVVIHCCVIIDLLVMFHLWRVVVMRWRFIVIPLFIRYWSHLRYSTVFFVLLFIVVAGGLCGCDIVICFHYSTLRHPL